jgi:hypothetical protein
VDQAHQVKEMLVVLVIKLKVAAAVVVALAL